MSKKIKLAKPRATFLNSILQIKSRKSGRMVNAKDKRLKAQERRQLFEQFRDIDHKD